MTTIEPVLVTAFRESEPFGRARPATVDAHRLVAESNMTSTPTAMLPLPTLRPRRATRTDSHYVVSVVDATGRIADRSPVRKLGWSAGTRLAFRVNDATVVATVDPDGGDSVTGQGHLHLPARVRHALGLYPGDRLLIVAYIGTGVLLVFATSMLDAILGTELSASAQR